MSAIPDYLVIGHVTQDVLPDGSLRAGGTATYAALTAQRLGLRVGVLTSAEPVLSLFSDQPSICVVRRPAKRTTTFQNIYADGFRRQYIRAVAEPLSLTELPDHWRRASIVHLGPVANEVDCELVEAFPGSLLGVTPQGWLRQWDEHGLVSPSVWKDAERVLSAVDVVVLSPEDVGGDQAVLERFRRLARLLVVTIGSGGAIVYHEGRQERVPAYAVREIDPTGAGDVFAAAYFVRFSETHDAIESARFANCTASFVVEDIGASSIPSREQVEQRLLYGSLRE